LKKETLLGLFGRVFFLGGEAMMEDTSLCDIGIEPNGVGRILLLACGALAREILDILNTSGWAHIDLKCLPALLHNSPADIPAAVRKAVEQHRKTYNKIYVVYADCGTGGLLKQTCDALGVEMIDGPHCYSFFEGNIAFEARDEMTCFYLTDFLVRQFDVFVMEPLGLDRHPELRSMYFGHYTMLVYQAQTDDADLTAKAKDCAARLGLAFERRFTGYGDMQRAITSWAKI
jgi:hypothetical protein